MPDNQLSIAVVVDASQLNSALPAATAVANDAFTQLAAAQIRVSTASKELNSQLNTLAKSGLVPTAEQTEEVAAAMFEAESAASAFAAASQQAYGSTEKLASGANNARIAFGGLVQDIGIRGSRALGSFIAQSETLAPLMSAAFSGIAAIAFVEILSRIPDAIKKASESLMGWNAAAKEAYQFQLKLNQTIADHRKELELDKISNAEAGLKGAAKTAQEIQDIEKKIALLTKYRTEQEAVGREAQKELDAVKVIPAHMAGRVLVEQQEIKIIAEGSDAWKERTQRIKDAQQKTEEYQNQILKLQQVEKPRAEANFAAEQAADAEKAAKEIETLQQKAAREHNRLEKQEEEETHKRILAELNDEERLAKERTKELEFSANITKEFNRNIEAEEKRLDAAIARDKEKSLSQAARAQEKYVREIQKALKEEQKFWDDMFKQVGHGLDRSIQGFLTGHQTIAASFAKLGNDILMTMIHALTKILMEHIAHSALVQAIEASSIGQRLAIFAAGEATKQALQTTSNVAQVTSDAGVGAAAAFASVMQALPFPINISTAPGVAAATLGSIEGFASVASAAGGMLVPADGTLSMLHKNEMVLPANLSQAIQRMTASGGGGEFGGGGGGGHTFQYINHGSGSAEQTRASSKEFFKMAKREIRRMGNSI
jgi:hypothetical protein